MAAAGRPGAEGPSAATAGTGSTVVLTASTTELSRMPLVVSTTVSVVVTLVGGVQVVVRELVVVVPRLVVVKGWSRRWRCLEDWGLLLVVDRGGGRLRDERCPRLLLWRHGHGQLWREHWLRLRRCLKYARQRL